MPRTAYVSARRIHYGGDRGELPSWSNLEKRQATRDAGLTSVVFDDHIQEQLRVFVSHRLSDWSLAQDLARRLYEGVRSQSELLGSQLALLVLQSRDNRELASGATSIAEGSPEPLRPFLEAAPDPAFARHVERIAGARQLPGALKVIFEDEAN